MALYDNKYWLMSHIRNSFIATDATGMCEVVMVGEGKHLQENIFMKESFRDSEQSGEEDDDEDAGSYDLQINADYSLSRERSMTAARLEKLEYHSKKAAKIKHVKWESKSDKNTDDTAAKDLFVIKKKEDKSDVKTPKKSALSALMEQSTHLPPNPYMEFAKFDGAGQINIPTKKYGIFLTMLPEDQRNYPLNVTCIATAKIQDLIGLILLKFSTNYAGDYAMKPVSNYGLYITEEDGEVDSDFSHLEPKECVAKFGFTCLGLVEHTEPPKVIARSDSYQAKTDNTASPDTNEKKRTTSSSKAEETKQIRHDLMIMDVHNKAMEAPLYKSYRVSIANKLLWWNIEVHLGISNEKIEIDPITQKNSKLQLVKQTPVSHPMDCIAWCEETESRGSKSNFRVVYASGYGIPTTDSSNMYTPSFGASSASIQSSPSFKHYDFEAEKSIADEIVQKINLILKLRSSHCRREYLAAKEKKHLGKRKSFKYLKP
ncbi:stress-activated map kinase-interacting protein 1 [Anthonomus grandis grandis]|uniref:stress-activated map kinase-interacting protein 1 n=1 Tax=Anthonomus grandis grandis TaxID=2921223 RepID=UPI0021662FE0|nr:stress-activated map kinase-interacting protein 1 [Anthonomus grandis grandis]